MLRVRFESAMKASRAQLLVAMAVGRDRMSVPALARIWAANGRPPSVQAARRALLLARDRMSMLGPATGNARRPAGCSVAEEYRGGDWQGFGRQLADPGGAAASAGAEALNGATAAAPGRLRGKRRESGDT